MQNELDEYVTMLEEGVCRLDPKLPAERILDVCSGGIRKVGGALPALYADKKDAIRAWTDAFDLARGFAGGFRWIERPKLEKYQITMMDARGTHRIVDNRYAVESRIVFA